MNFLSKLIRRLNKKKPVVASPASLFEPLEQRAMFTVAPVGIGIPNAPTGLVASTASATSIHLKWHDTSVVEDGFDIEASADNVNFLQFATAAPNAGGTTIAGLTTGKKYYFRVKAFNFVGDSTYTNVSSAIPNGTTTTPITPPPVVIPPVVTPPVVIPPVVTPPVITPPVITPPVITPPVVTPPVTPPIVIGSGPVALTAADWKGVGVDTSQDPSRLIPILKSMGVKSVRLWFGIASWKGTYGQIAINEAGQYKAAGFKTMICVDAPEVPTQATITAFFNHLITMPGALKNVDLWEIGNEPDRPPFWKGTASQYVNIVLKTAWNILHPLGMKIVGAGPSWDPNYGQQMVNAGYLQYCDYANFHAYGNSAKDIISRAAQYQKVYAGKPILISEWNVHTITDPTQWVAALNQIEAAIKNDAMSIFYYCLVKNTSSVGNSGILLPGSLSGNGPFYDMFKNW